MGCMMGFAMDTPASRMNSGDSEDTASTRPTFHAASWHRTHPPGNPHVRWQPRRRLGPQAIVEPSKPQHLMLLIAEVKQVRELDGTPASARLR